MDNSTPNKHFTALRDNIARHFDLGELNTLCFDLGADFDELPGQTKTEKAQNLLANLNRRDRIPALIEHLKKQRPHVDWEPYQPAELKAEPPFKGLQYFDETDAHLFFGREQLTTELVDHLRQHRFLAVVGASGSGKSSVVRAGVIPAVRRGDIEQNGRSSTTWPIHIIAPGYEPLKALAASLTREVRLDDFDDLLKKMRTSVEGLDLFLARQVSIQPNYHLFLVVDQFEELFAQCKDIEERRLFVENMVYAVQSGKQGWLSLILALRADFYAYAVQYEALRPLLETRQKIVGDMSQEELCQAIVKPAEQGKWQFQPGLVETMLQDVGREPGALPLLSHALQETWERREGRVMTLAGYQAAGGVRKAIAITADAVYASLNESQQTIARNIFLRLTELGEGTEDTRRRATLEELLPQGQTLAEVQTVLDLLTRKRLVTLNEERKQGDAAQNYAEVAHEALIREWAVLQDWLKNNRDSLRLHRELSKRAKQWEQNGRSGDLLYRGGQLARASEWDKQNPTELNDLERAFLMAGVEEADRQRQHDLQLAIEQRTASRFRYLTAGILVLFVVALVAVGSALSNLSDTIAERDARATAQTQAEIAQGTSDANALLLSTRNAELGVAQSQAVDEAQAANKARATAEISADIAATAQAEADQDRSEAEQQARLAQCVNIE